MGNASYSAAMANESIKTDAVTFSGRLAAAMQERGLNQRELSEKIGHSTPGSVNQWVGGARRPSGKNLDALAAALEVDAEWLRGDPSVEFGSAIPTSGIPSDAAAMATFFEHVGYAIAVAKASGWTVDIRADLDGDQFRMGTGASLGRDRPS